MFLEAFDRTPVLDPHVLLETLSRVRDHRLKRSAAFKSLLKMTAMVKAVGELASIFGPTMVAQMHGLSAEDMDFVIACWERAGRPCSGAEVSLR